jgi:tripartite-type tricarboxylate transporter receptor subunit TctC
LTLRVGDTWPMFIWPAGFSAAAINIAMLPREGLPDWMIKSTLAWAKAAIVAGVAFVIAVFLYYVVTPWNFIGRADPVGGEAGYERVVGPARAQLQKTGATWIATTDYRTYAMLRWFFKDRVPVVQINERGRFEGFRDPGMNAIRGHAGLYVGREPDNLSPLWAATTAVRQPLERVERSWRGIVMDTYALEKLTGWTPEISPPPDSPLYRARTLAGKTRPLIVAVVTNDRDKAAPEMSFRVASIRDRIQNVRSYRRLALSACVVRCGFGRRLPRSRNKMVVPFAAGGGTDVLARIIAQNLNSKWGQPVVVENQPGASGAIGTRAVIKAAPDGYTLLMASTGALMAVSAGAGGDGPFDVNKYLTPIVIGAAPPYLLVASPTLPVKTTADLIRYAKEKPEGLTLAPRRRCGAASSRPAVRQRDRDQGCTILTRPPAVTDLSGGRIDMMFAPGPVVQQFVASGQFKALGVTDTQRSKFYPDVPTVADAVPGYESVGWFGLLAPPNTPPEIVRKINEVIVSAMNTQEFRDHLATLGAEPKPQTPEEFGRYINADVAKWSKLVKDNDVQLPGGK